MRDEPIVRLKCQIFAHQKPERVSVCIDSRTVTMEVGIRSEVCNNLPA